MSGLEAAMRFVKERGLEEENADIALEAFKEGWLFCYEQMRNVELNYMGVKRRWRLRLFGRLFPKRAGCTK